jgi:hypothetical protein
MYSYDNKIHVIENFVSQETANFLVDNIKNFTRESPDKGISAGPMLSTGLEKISLLHKMPWDVPEFNNKNIVIDIITMLIGSMSKTICDFYNLDYIPTNFFYSKMTEGGKNDLHMDNYYIENNVPVPKPYNNEDRSGLLYLNEEYEGGILSFPNQNLNLKPKTGTFIFFTGDNTVPHEVTPVISGERHNIVSFYWPKTKLGNRQDRYVPGKEYD